MHLLRHSASDPSLNKAKGVKYKKREEEGLRRRNTKIAELFSKFKRL